MSNPYQTPGHSDPFGAPEPQGPYSGQSYSPSSYGSAGYDPAPPNAYSSGGYAPYAQPLPYNYPVMLPDHPQATVVLILGVLSVVGLAITGPFAWYFGNKARKEIAANPGVYKDGGTLTAGWVMGIIGSVLLMISALVLVGYVILWIFLAAVVYAA